VKLSTAVSIVAAAVAVPFHPSAASASLGGTVSSVEADRVQMKSALVRIARSDVYTVHEIQSPTGTTIREYYGASGVVFGVSWDGEFPPDLRQLLGTYFDHYRTAVQTTRRGRKARGRLAIDDSTLIVRTGAHTRSFSGIAYAPNLIPAGVSPSVVR
jgi:uncharacterized protein DUF2844